MLWVAGVVLVAAGAAAGSWWWLLDRPAGYGLTYAQMDDLAPATGVVHLGCGGSPAAVDQPGEAGCNPVQGDTSCRASRPLLCALPAAPGALIKDGPLKDWGSNTWAVTQPVRGTTLTSAASADQLCKTEIGSGWFAAQWTSRGADAMRGIRGSGLTEAGTTRYWVVAPSDSTANCWAKPQ